MSFLYKNDTRELTKLPKRKKAIGCKWVFVKKRGSSDGDTVRYKVRLIAKITLNKKTLTTMRYSHML